MGVIAELCLISLVVGLFSALQGCVWFSQVHGHWSGLSCEQCVDQYLEPLCTEKNNFISVNLNGSLSHQVPHPLPFPILAPAHHTLTLPPLTHAVSYASPPPYFFLLSWYIPGPDDGTGIF